MKDELIKRCTELLERTPRPNIMGSMVKARLSSRLVIKDGYYIIEISCLMGALRVECLPGGTVLVDGLDMIGQDCYSTGFAEEVVLPIIRRHMVLDDLASA